MRADNFNIQEFIESLQGTCSSLDEKLTSDYAGMEVEDLTNEEIEHIDTELFRCEQCDWWCEVSEFAEDCEDGEQICQECKSDNE